MTTANVALVRALISDFLNGHRPGLAPRFFTEDFWWTGSPGTIEGRDAYQSAVAGFWAGLPDVTAAEEHIIDAAGTVVARLTVTGTNTGELWGVPPTGRRVSWPALMIYQIRDGKVAKQWAAEDLAAILTQLGQRTPPWGAQSR
jgi:predicted ester cyclase